jgi:hypothetical protein
MEDTLTKSVERGTYQGLVDAVLGQVQAALTNDAYGDEDEPTAKRLRLLRTEEMTPGQRAMEARFALGADDALYLQSAVSVLSAGHEGGLKGHEVAIPEGQFLGPNVISGVRRAVEADIARRAHGRLNEAPRRLKETLVVLVWLLRIPEIREAVHALLPTTGNAHFAELAALLKPVDAIYNPENLLNATSALVARGGDGLEAVCRVVNAVYSMLDPAFAPAKLAADVVAEIEKGVSGFVDSSKQVGEKSVAFLRGRVQALSAMLATTLRQASERATAHKLETDRLNAKLNEVQKKIVVLIGERREARKHADAQRKELVKKTREIERHGRRIEEQEQEIEDLEGFLVAEDVKIEEKQQQIEELEGALQQLRQEKKALEEKVGVVSRARDALDLQLNQSRGDLYKQEKKTAAKQAKIVQIEAERDQARADLKERSAQLVASEKRVAGIRKNLNEMRGSLAAVQEDLRQANAAYGELDSQKRAVNRLLLTRDAQLLAANRELAESQAREASLRGDVAQRDGELAAMTTRAEAAEESFRLAEEREVALGGQLTERIEAIKQLELDRDREIARLGLDNDDAIRQLGVERDQQLTVLQAELAALEASLQALQTRWKDELEGDAAGARLTVEAIRDLVQKWDAQVGPETLPDAFKPFRPAAGTTPQQPAGQPGLLAKAGEWGTWLVKQIESPVGNDSGLLARHLLDLHVHGELQPPRSQPASSSSSTGAWGHLDQDELWPDFPGEAELREVEDSNFAGVVVDDVDPAAVYAFVAKERNKVESVPADAPPIVRYAEIRGLVGQRGPEEASYEADHEDKCLPYNAPWSEGGDDPHMAELTHHRRAEHIAAAEVAVSARTSRALHQLHASVNTQTALNRLNGDYAMIPLPEGQPYPNLEVPYYARWRPVGRLAEMNARVAALEHACQRCSSFSTTPGIDDDASLYKSAAAALKLQQLQPLYRVHLRLKTSNVAGETLVASDTWTTRPLARVNQRLCYPTDAGLHAKSKRVQGADIAQGVDWRGRKPKNAVPDYTFRQLTVAVQRLAVDDTSVGLPAPPIFVAPEAGRLPLGRSVDDPIPLDLEDLGDLEEIVDHLEALSADRLRGLFRVAIDYCELLADDAELKAHGQTSSAAVVAAAASAATGSGSSGLPSAPALGSAAAVRGGLWKELLRELAISNDRLWIFVRTLSGAIGEDASSLLSSADEDAQRAQRALDTERKAIAERVATFQAKIVEILVTNMLKSSKLEMLPEGDAFVVVDAEAAKDLRQLASGESGRPFFEANVAIQAILQGRGGQKTKLADLIASFNTVVSSVHQSLTAELEQGTSFGGASINELAAPRNSYFVSLRNDVTAAIRIAVDRFHHEIGSTRPRLYELIEGVSSNLSLRFAETVGHVLVQNRNSTGASALYVSAATQSQTASQARVALLRLVSEARNYLVSAPSPDFGSPAGRQAYFGLGKGRDMSGITGRKAVGPPIVVQGLLVSSDVSGWMPGHTRW